MVRLYIDRDLYRDEIIALDKKQTHYLINVLRSKLGNEVLVFNGRDGEWLAKLDKQARDMVLVIDHQTRKQDINVLDINIAMPVIKIPRLKILLEKATELGVNEIQLIITDYTQIHNVNMETMQSIVIEAAEQCGRIDIPKIYSPIAFDKYMQELSSMDRLILVGDETGEGKNLLHLLHGNHKGALLMVGPEGGWSVKELDKLRITENVQMVDLGKNILRSETSMMTMISAISLLGYKDA